MSERTAIEWADSTFNPWIGCTKVSPACDHCYAETLMDGRLGRVKWGAGQPRVRTSAANWQKPLQWDRAGLHECVACGWRGDDKSLAEPRRVCPACSGSTFRAARRRVFCASLADVFDNEVPIAWLIDLLDLIRRTPHLDWLLLTKRIGNVGRIVTAALDAAPTNDALRAWVVDWWSNGKPPANVWLGATICNQAEADRDVPKLLATPASMRFVSIEPMLGPINLNRIRDPHFRVLGSALSAAGYPRRVDWVIVGGESGPNARPLHPDWVRSLRDQCAAAGVPLLFKQWGEFRPPLDQDEWEAAASRGETYGGSLHISGTFVNRGGGMLRVGKKAAGRTLDGREHTEFPGVGA